MRISKIDEPRVEDSGDPLKSGDDQLLTRRECVRVGNPVDSQQIIKADAEPRCSRIKAVSRLDNVDRTARFLSVGGMIGKKER